MHSKKVGGRMAQERTSMRKIREVLRLHFEAQISQAKIAGVAKLSRSTVQQYIMRFMAAGLSWPIDLRDDDLERRLFPVDKGKNNRPEPDYLYYLRRSGSRMPLWLYCGKNTKNSIRAVISTVIFVIY